MSATSAEIVRERVGKAATNGSLGIKFADTLSRYLNRRVRCSSGVTISDPGVLWEFEGAGLGLRWSLRLQEGLVFALVDAMIGGSGSAKRGVSPARVRRLIETLALKIFECAATASGVEAIVSVAPTGAHAARPTYLPVASGLCAVEEEFWWELGVADDVAPAQEPIEAASPSVTAIRGAAAAIAALARAPYDVSHINEIGPARSLREDELEVCRPHAPAFAVRIDFQNARVLADAALKARLPEGSALGPVVVSVVESLLLAALAEFAAEYPASNRTAQSDAVAIVTHGRIENQPISMIWIAPTVVARPTAATA